MINTNQMVSVPCELLEQALDAAAAVGMQDVADELDRILTPTTEQHQATTGVLWRHREKKPNRVWHYTAHQEIAERAIRMGCEVQGFADIREAERWKASAEHFTGVSIKAVEDVNNLRAQLADLKQRHDGLHRDMATIAGREVPKGCTVADYAAAAIADAISTCAEPNAPAYPQVRIVRAHMHTCANVQPGSTADDICDCGAVIDGKAVEVEPSAPTCNARGDQGAPTPKTIPATLMQAMENLAVKALAANHPPFFPPGAACQAPLVMLGGVCLRVTYSGLKWYHDQLIDDRWEPLSVEEFEALLTTALHGCTEESNP